MKTIRSSQLTAIEDNLIDTHDFTKSTASNLYRLVFAEKVKSLPIKISDGELLTTLHKTGNTVYVTVINHFENERCFKLDLPGYKLSRTVYGTVEKIKPYDACIFEFTKE